MSAEPPKLQEKQKKARVNASLSIQRRIELGVLKLLFTWTIWINCWSLVAFRFEMK